MTALCDPLDALLARGLDQGLYLGAVYAVARGEEVLARGAVGRRQEAPEAPAEWDTVFDLASLTKPVATATAVLLLAAEGAFHLGEEIGALLPAATAGRLDGNTLRHLLTHTSGLPAWRDFHSHGWGRDEIVARVAATDREHPIGARYVYSDLGYILLGALVEAVTGEPLDRVAEERIFRPLGMTDTGYRPLRIADCGLRIESPDNPQSAIRNPQSSARLAATRCPRRGVLLGVVHDENAAAMEGVAGHAGLFGTAPDLVRYAAALLAALGARERRKAKGEKRLSSLSPFAFRLSLPFTPLVAAQMARNALDPAVGGSSLGWFTAPNGMLPAGDFLPGDSFGHTGFTGTSLVIVPSLDLTILLLTNRVYQEQDAAPFLRFRRRFHNAVAGALLPGSAAGF